MHRGGQRREVMFQNEVRGPGLEGFDGHFFAERAGNENERHIRNFILSDGQSGETVECGQAMIRKDYGGVKRLNLFYKALLSIDSLETELEAAVLQGMLHQRGIVRPILNH